MGGSKRKRGGGPRRLYQRAGVFYARVQVDGREHRRSLKTGDRREAERRLDSWLKERSPYKGTIRHTFKEAAALWLEAGEWKAKTAAGYVKLLTILLDHFGEHFWDQVDKAALMNFMEVRRQKGSGTATINRYLTVVSGIANHVREMPGWPELNPVDLLPRKPRRERRQSYIRPPASDVEAMLAAAGEGAFGDLCRLALLTGARKDELALLKRDDADGPKLQLWETKSHFRVIPLDVAGQAIVKRQPKGRSPFLFLTRNGGHYKRVTEMWRETVNRAQKAAQDSGGALTRMRFHDLRHEYAIRYLESGRSIYTLQKLLGHGSIRQTEQYLRYLTPEQAAVVMGSAQ